MEFDGLQRKRDYKTTKKAVIIAITVIILLIPFMMWQNNTLTVTEYDKYSSILPDAFDGYTIIHLSDLHSKNFKGRGAAKVCTLNPDIIVITGDLIDLHNRKLDVAEDTVKMLTNIAQVYFVTGNHEISSPIYLSLLEIFDRYGVTVLDNEQQKIYIGEQSITIYGYADADAISTDVALDKEHFNLVLCHRPYAPEVFNKVNADLVLCGHAHGGQIRLPFVGGLIAPDQGFFPEYYQGMHDYMDTSVVISRGLGRSILPLRLFNMPEIVVITLHK
ncbi:MAG: putative metallophosphoesterase [Firmicutes bacterium ADurb.Bin099]|nr:MAG: putative metallophosphoesterase [Firmicutes bacterium ADurb.Bin099]